ncbi:YqiJ family protein [Glaciecola sp. 1036]|uniref:YqiJ family protein n=1 Tax=Alteromonadaceae TaxID=72275 RepID=UPI003D047F24
MIEFLLSDANTLYTVAICIVIGLGLVEGLAMIFGLSIGALFDGISPIDMDFELEAEISSGGLTGILGWLALNRLPLMIWFVLFMTCFGLSGWTANYLFGSLFGVLLPTLISFPVALAVGLTLTGRIGKRLARFMPKNESSAINTDTFGGRIATITLGTARVGSPSEASFVDSFKQKHYVMVEPIENGQEFHVGQQVVLVEKGPNSWLATNMEASTES